MVVPSYRRPGRLLSCLQGLACQTRLPDEVIAVAREEDSETQQRLRSWLAGRPDFAPCLKTAIVTRPGQIPAMNVGLDAATGDVVCYTDDDCVPRPDWIERLLVHYADPAVGGVGGRDVVHYGDETVEVDVTVVGKYQWFGRPIGNHHLHYAPHRPVTVDILKGANMSFRRELLGHFDEALQLAAAQCNDLDASLSLRRRGYRLVYDPDAIVDHYPAERHGPSTRRYDTPHMLFAEGHNWMYVALKHAPWWQVPVVVVYGFLVGHARAYGVLRAAVAALAEGPVAPTRRLRHSLRGKSAALSRWLGRRRPAAP